MCTGSTRTLKLSMKWISEPYRLLGFGSSGTNGQKQTLKAPDRPIVRTHIIDVLDLCPAAKLGTVTVLLPLIHNPTRFHIRIPVWPGNVWRAIRELQDHFSGMTTSVGIGWSSQDAS